jgi:adenylylsulfate kinase
MRIIASAGMLLPASSRTWVKSRIREYDQSAVETRTTTGAVIWLTGLSGAGKSTIAQAVAAEFERRGRAVELLDGDALRAVMPTGFSRQDREAHVRRVGFFASRLAHHGVIVLAALVSPYRASRDFVRSLCEPSFFEVHVATSLETCERRDVKGLYARARRGELQGFTGIDDPYEPPLRADLVVDTATVPLADTTARLVRLVETTC